MEKSLNFQAGTALLRGDSIKFSRKGRAPKQKSRIGGGNGRLRRLLKFFPFRSCIFPMGSLYWSQCARLRKPVFVQPSKEAVMQERRPGGDRPLRREYGFAHRASGGRVRASPRWALWRSSRPISDWSRGVFSSRACSYTVGCSSAWPPAGGRRGNRHRHAGASPSASALWETP